MLRRIVSTCVLIGFIASQWAAVPHMHAHETDAKHGHTSPHMHLSWFGSSTHMHGHEHGPGGTHHHQAAVPNDSSAATPSDQATGEDDHDGDAVYLPGGVPRATTTSIAEALALKGQAAHLALLAYDPGFAAELSATCCTASRRPPDERHPGCALYLTLRTLRI